ncbi:MAG: TonB-dependent receptor [Acidobacteriota bacterium]
MRKICYLLAALLLLTGLRANAQTTSGLLTGTILDSGGAVIAGARVDVVSQAVDLHRSAVTRNTGGYLIPDLPPGIYTVTVTKDGFAVANRINVELQVNQPLTMDFTLPPASVGATVTVTGHDSALNATSATLGDVIDHQTIVDIPLDGREFTQLTLLTPGASPIQAPQQAQNIVERGAGGVVPSVNGQRPRQNNYTMDGVQNNNIFSNIFAISPPPEVLEQFNVQSHITDAQFAISTGSNINIVSRSGTDTFHGDAWEFTRNDIFDAQTFPSTARLPYQQNQYGLSIGGPVLLPHWSGRKNTWFEAYWSGFRSHLEQLQASTTFTDKMLTGDFTEWYRNAVIGTDDLGRPEHKYEIYDPATSRPDPKDPTLIVRDPFPGNIIPTNRFSPAALAILNKFFPRTNVPGKLASNIVYNQITSVRSEEEGIKLDHKLRNNDTVFVRYNREDRNGVQPRPLPTQTLQVQQFAQVIAIGYTHLLGQSSVLDLHYGFTNSNTRRGDTPAGEAFVKSINFQDADPIHNGVYYGPEVAISNGTSGEDQQQFLTGPQYNSDYHADYSHVLGPHLFSAGGMFYHVNSYSDSQQYTVRFTANATGQGGLTDTGIGPASFLLGLPDNFTAPLGNTAVDQSVNWYGVYVQDQWKAARNLTLSFGLRWDYVAPPNFHKVVSGFDPIQGKYLVSAPVLPSFPIATAGAGIFQPQYNGFEPRFGLSYSVNPRAVFHAAFAILDDHNNTLAQENQSVRSSWPTAITANEAILNRSLPQVSLDQMPTAASFLIAAPQYVGYGVYEHNKIPYAMEYNFGLQQQWVANIVSTIDYVGSVTRHDQIAMEANTATTPGPGTLASRGQPYPQFAPFGLVYNGGSASYNALQVKVNKTFSRNISIITAYTFSKTLDIQSDADTSSIDDIYHLRRDWGPADFDLRHIFVFSSTYGLPFGKGQRFLGRAHGMVQGAVGNWRVALISSVLSGSHFNALAGSDLANVGAAINVQRGQVIGNPYSGAGFHQSVTTWVNPDAFTTPALYTFGNEGRNDLVGPGFSKIDVAVIKNISLPEHGSVQFRAEAFNVLNTTNLSTPIMNIAAAGFGSIQQPNGFGRILQFAIKVQR